MDGTPFMTGARRALAVWLSTLIIGGINITADSAWGTFGTAVLVAIIFGVVNAVIKPIVKLVGCGLYVLTLGLIALVVNGLLFWLVSWIAGGLGIPFHVDNFWPSAVLGALIVFHRNDERVQEINLFGYVLLVQSLPFLAAVALATFENSRINDFVLWKTVETKVVELLPRELLPRRNRVTEAAAAPEKQMEAAP